MSDWAAQRHAAFQAAIDDTETRIHEAVRRDVVIRRYFVPDVRTECCDAPVVADPGRPHFMELVLALACARCGNDVGSPGPEDITAPNWEVHTI
jgi:hypothetical protein